MDTHFLTMGSKTLFVGLFLSVVAPVTAAVNNAPADADSVKLRVSCVENGGSVEIPNCFNSIAAVDTWLRNVRQAGPAKPTLVEIGPGTFGAWNCLSSHVTLRGSGRERTVIHAFGGSSSSSYGMRVGEGCTNLNVQDLKVVGGGLWGIVVEKLDSITTWTNVEVEGTNYGWAEGLTTPGGQCPNNRGRHFWFSSRIISTGTGGVGGSLSRAYRALCSESWFWGSEVRSVVPGSAGAGLSFAIEALTAEIHLYGSNVSVHVRSGVNADNLDLITASSGGEVHIHGTGLDVIHDGTGTVEMLYAADPSSHFHANESGFNIHVSGPGYVRRLAGPGGIESPYTWGAAAAPPLSSAASGVHRLLSRSGTDTYIETDCPLSGNCSAGGTFPHLMIYRAECTDQGINQGPWFDTVTNACRQ